MHIHEGHDNDDLLLFLHYYLHGKV